MKRTTTDVTMHMAHFEDDDDEERTFETDPDSEVLRFLFGSFSACACSFWWNGGGKSD